MVSGEEPDVLRKFVADNKLGYTIARDDGDRVAAQFGVEGLPMLYVIDKTGVVREVVRGAGDLTAVDALVDKLLR